MTDTKAATAHKPMWIDLSSSDAAAARDFYSRLFGWKVDVNPDPQYGGYALATLDGKIVAGVGPKMSPEGPSAWMVYVGSADAAETGKKAQAAGGILVMGPMSIGDQGVMSVLQDPTGAFFGIWEPKSMTGAELMNKANTFGWAELSARGIDKAKTFYREVFGWGEKSSDMGEGRQYTEFMLGDNSIAGALEMSPMVPAAMPSYWLVYFTVDDVDKAFARAKSLGATEMMAPMDFTGGRFAIVGDPQGAAFGLLKQTA